jgi:hypothetical protein
MLWPGPCDWEDAVLISLVLALGLAQAAPSWPAPPAAAAPVEPAGPGAERVGTLTTAAKDLGAAHQGATDLSGEVAKLTGAQLSPLFMLGVLGGWRWIAAAPEERARLPWHAQPWFWGGALALVALLFASDKVPVLRQAVKHVKLLENKLSGVLAAVVLVGSFAEAASRQVGQALVLVGDALVPSALAADPAAGSGAALAASAGYGLAVVVGLVISGAVWLAGHSVNVLSLLNPFAPLDSAMRASRLAAIGLLLGAAKLSAVLGLVVAAACIGLALLIAGWSFRLMVFGLVFSLDFLLGREAAPGPGGVVAFATDGADGVAPRTYGRVVWREGRAELHYRPWLVLPRRRVRLPACDGIGRGLLSPVLLAVEGHRAEVLVRFPPRYRRRAGELAAALGGQRLVDLPLLGGLKAAVAWLRGEVEV